ncbi:uncharacterized protein BJ171DRAFT_175265 [Polychytrium aggregatum]|uniref:uncharacterized protein n=1 Tax=Polychytrium aggregatum TaxID=110093 RepID=UPI0022FECE73|nr:uncharacterized protein BJ171DRAFT_175265 [Polychytrium aggregatum]KAI9209092.1 hypothetical protein BJ171DRAFT_175265 [Polychytrium aggregatum]
MLLTILPAMVLSTAAASGFSISSLSFFSLFFGASKSHSKPAKTASTPKTRHVAAQAETKPSAPQKIARDAQADTPLESQSPDSAYATLLSDSIRAESATPGASPVPTSPMSPVVAASASISPVSPQLINSLNPHDPVTDPSEPVDRSHSAVATQKGGFLRDGWRFLTRNVFKRSTLETGAQHLFRSSTSKPEAKATAAATAVSPVSASSFDPSPPMSGLRSPLAPTSSAPPVLRIPPPPVDPVPPKRSQSLLYRSDDPASAAHAAGRVAAVNKFEETIRRHLPSDVGASSSVASGSDSAARQAAPNMNPSKSRNGGVALGLSAWNRHAPGASLPGASQDISLSQSFFGLKKPATKPTKAQTLERQLVNGSYQCLTGDSCQVCAGTQYLEDGRICMACTEQPFATLPRDPSRPRPLSLSKGADGTLAQGIKSSANRFKDKMTGLLRHRKSVETFDLNDGEPSGERQHATGSLFRRGRFRKARQEGEEGPRLNSKPSLDPGPFSPWIKEQKESDRVSLASTSSSSPHMPADATLARSLPRTLPKTPQLSPLMSPAASPPLDPRASPEMIMEDPSIRSDKLKRMYHDVLYNDVSLDDLADQLAMID